MLFLFRGEVKGVAPLPPEQFMELAVKQVETLMSYKQQGKILAGGIMAGRRGSYAIWNVDSIEELQKLAQVYHRTPEAEAKTGQPGILWTLHLFHPFGLEGFGWQCQGMIDLEMEGLGVPGLPDVDSLSLLIGN